MMQMLAAGGISPLTDSVRAPDADNPRGYFEFEAVKRTRQDSTWVSLAVGKAVKVVHALLNDLPGGFEYRVILMNRPIAEVIRSQEIMLERSGKSVTSLPRSRMGELLEQQLSDVESQISRRSEFRVLRIEFHDCLYRPETVVAALSTFLGPRFDPKAAVAAVDPALHRNR